MRILPRLPALLRCAYQTTTTKTKEGGCPVYLHALPYRYVLGTRVDATTSADAASVILQWARAEQSKFVCSANVRLVMTAHDDGLFRRIVNSADLVISDGLPLAWTLRAFGVESAASVRGCDLLTRVCDRSAREGVAVGLLVSGAGRATALRHQLERAHPGLNLAYVGQLPDGRTSAREEERLIGRINESGSRILLVAGESRNEQRWIVEHKGRIKSVMLGVGRPLHEAAAVHGDSIGLGKRHYSAVKANIRFVTLVMLQWLGLRTTWS